MAGFVQDGRSAALSAMADQEYAAGEAALPRWSVISSGGFQLVNGTVFLSYLSAKRTETCNNIKTQVGNTAAVTPTLCRMGVYAVAANGDLSLLAASANDTTLWNATFVTQSRALTTPFNKAQGQLYALAVIVVGAATPPRLFGPGPSVVADDMFGTAPRRAAMLTGQTDLPATIPNGTLVSVSGASGAPAQVIVTP